MILPFNLLNMKWIYINLIYYMNDKMSYNKKIIKIEIKKMKINIKIKEDGEE